MKILICSDGHAQAENAVRFISGTAAACGADVTLLGIIEHPSDEPTLLEALRRAAALLRDKHVTVEMITHTGSPLEEIQKLTRAQHYDFVVIGAERKGGGQFAMSSKAYHIIKEIEPPVLAVMGERADLKRILICSGGKSYIDNAVKLTSEIACKSQLSVTILHVLPDIAPIYQTLIEREETLDKVLASATSLGRNLRSEKTALESAGVTAEIKLRYGLVVEEILAEATSGGYDMIVTGSAPAHAPIRTYILGDVTQELINRADCAVFVVRGGPIERKGFLIRLVQFFTGSGGEKNDK
jgi:nucleotide-binding universal stress UspA family protein